PAPHVPLAPVMLQFAITNATSSWSVIVNGVTVNAPATQATLTVSIWDSTDAAWTIQAGPKSYSDKLRVQRPSDLLGVGVGAFTIPVPPVSVVHAPLVDSLGASGASYTPGQTVGTTVSTSIGKDKSQTVPDLHTTYGNWEEFKGFLDTAAQVLSLSKDNP